MLPISDGTVALCSAATGALLCVNEAMPLVHCARVGEVPNSGLYLPPAESEDPVASSTPSTSGKKGDKVPLLSEHLTVSSVDGKKTNLLTESKDYWQSSGSKPHSITVRMPKGRPFGKLEIHGGRNDKSYFPNRVRVSAGETVGKLQVESFFFLLLVLSYVEHRVGACVR